MYQQSAKESFFKITLKVFCDFKNRKNVFDFYAHQNKIKLNAPHAIKTQYNDVRQPKT